MEVRNDHYNETDSLYPSMNEPDHSSIKRIYKRLKVEAHLFFDEMTDTKKIVG